jgi:purine-binding chemotaxis protein CheW
MGTPAGRGKRGRKAGSSGRPDPEPVPASPPAEADTEAGFVFPSDADPAEARRGPITLPPSGLAADILALAGAAAVPALGPSRPAPVPASAGEAAPRAHNISFFAAPVREERKAAEATEHLATFFLGREEYGVDVRLVQEIIRVSEITQVPRAPDFINGVINLRGRIIPVVDLKKKLGLGVVEIVRTSRIVVVKIKERLVGLLVDGASQVLRVPVSAIEAAPDEVTEIDAHAIRGVAKLPGRLIILMDLTKTLSLELKEQADEPAGSN